MNAIMQITPYRQNGMWVFDDTNAGLIKEPFVSGIDKMIDHLVTAMPDANNGFNMLFSANPFPGYDVFIDWRGAEYGGNWYWCDKYKILGWLCPALFCYFDKAPEKIYVKAVKIK